VDRVCVTDVWGRVEPENPCTLTRGAKGVTWCSGVGWFVNLVVVYGGGIGGFSTSCRTSRRRRLQLTAGDEITNRATLLEWGVH
jgi:hypothetical protein